KIGGTSGVRWWLRSGQTGYVNPPGMMSYCVSAGGAVGTNEGGNYGYNYWVDYSQGVRPAFVLKI
ncbi:MAG: DUF6273 domain-containing protein, partial [Clostridia bacterium]